MDALGTVSPVPARSPTAPPGAATFRRSLELIVYEIRTASVGSVLGVAWSVVQPLLLLGAYWFLLTVLEARHLGAGGTGSQIVILLSGLVPWLFLARSSSMSLNALTRHAPLIRQTNFPTGILPFISVGVQAVDFVVGLIVILVLAAATGLLSWPVLLVLPVTLLLGAFLVGVAALLAPLAVMLRDLRRLMQVALRAGMFLTPVLYLPTALDGAARALAYVNPAAYFIGLLRYAVTGVEDALLFGAAADLAIVSAVTAAVCLAAYAFRRRAWRMTIDHI